MLIVNENLCYDSQNEKKIMKFKMTPIKIVTALIFGIAGFSFSLSYMDSAATRYEIQNRSSYSSKDRSTFTSRALLNVLEANRPESELLMRLFQLMFILFFISPPIIALMLFLIWKELKKGDKLK